MRQLVLALVFALMGCHHAQKPPVQPTPAPSLAMPAQGPKAPSVKPAGAKTCASDDDCGATQLCIRRQCVDITPGLAECGMLRLHFDYNAAELKHNELTALQRVSRCLKAEHALQVTVEGHADERGTDEYNLALGDRRATSVQQYLETLGVSPEQLRRVSYGKLKPLCAEHDEACWSKNRRAAIKPKDAGTKSRKK